MRYKKNAVVLSAAMWLGAVLILLFSASQVSGQMNCEWGKYGENCDKACPEHCVFNKDRKLQHCHKITGKCSEGCMPGWHGNQCDNPCSSHCHDNICNQQNGLCAFGCNGSYTGDFCNITTTTVVTTHATLPTTEATPPDRATNIVVIIVPVVVIILCLVIVAVVVCMLYRRKRTRKRKANIESRFQENIPLMGNYGTNTARPERGVAQEESDPLDQKINNTRDLFVETESFKKVREMLETFHHVTISGAPGVGKTSMALMLGAEYRNQGYELVLVEDLDKVHLSDWQGDGKDVCLIFDDIFQMAGPYFDVPRLTRLLYGLHLHLTHCKNRLERRYESYQQESWEEGRRDTQSNMYLIFTSDSTILERALSHFEGQTFRFFNSCTTADLTTTESLSYTEEEKKEIWLKHKSHAKYKVKVDAIKLTVSDRQSIGFPLVCKLLSSYPAFQENHESFFEKPVSTLKLELEEVITRRDDLSAGLILVLLSDEQLNIAQLETEPDLVLETHLQAVRTLVPISSNQSVALAVRNLCGSLLTEGNVTTFSHSVIYDVCTSVLYSIEPEFIRKHFSIQFLMEHLQDPQVDIIPVNEHYLIIPFSKTYSRTLDRLVDSLVSGGAFDKYIMHPIWKRKEIVDKLSQKIKDVTSLSDHEKHNIFCYTCFIGNEPIMKKINPHCNINSPGLNGWTPAMYAAASGQKNILKLLVKSKADLKLCDNSSNTLLHVASEYGSTSVVKYLLQDHKFDINSRRIHGWTPLTCAVLADKMDVLDPLRKCKALRDTTIKNALSLAFEWGNRSIIETLLPWKGQNYRCKHGQTPIMCAGISGKKDIFDLLVARNADIKLCDDNNNNLLHLACEPDDTSGLQTLLQKIDINKPGQYGWTPVMKAAVNGRKDVYDLLVKENADINLTDDNGNNLLHLACHGGNVAIVNHLVPQFDINTRGGNGWTPIMYAAVNGHKIVFDLLVSKGANLSLKDDYSNSVFQLGCLGGNRAIVKELLPKADLKSQGNLGRTGVMKAAWAGNADVFKLLVTKNADLKTLDDNNDTILHLSSQSGNHSIVQYLIDEGVDINCRGKYDWTTVMNAASSGNKNVFDFLSSKQDSMSVYNVYGDTILHLACEGGDVCIVQLLLSTLDANLRGMNGRTPVMAAALAGKNEVFDLLVSKGADLKLIDDCSNNILHLACWGGNTLIIEYLRPIFDINVPGVDGLTPLMMSALSGKKEAYDLLATGRAAAKPSLTSKGDNVLHAACQGGSLAIVKEVCSSFEINCTGKNGQNPLMRAVCGGHIAVYKYLVSHGADHTLVDKDGHTLLHLASRHGQLAMLKHIIDVFDVNTQDSMGLTPAMTAVLHGKAAVFKCLKAKGVDLSVVDNTGDDALTLAVKLGCRQIINQLDRKQDKKVTPWNELMKSLIRGELTLLKTYRQQSPGLVQTDQAGDTLLHLACRGGNTKCVEYLLPSYDDIDVQGRYNWTPLMMAAACGHADVFKLLVDHKAGLFHVSGTGEDILTLARRANNAQIITYVENH